MREEDLREKIRHLPSNPGIYKYYDSDNTLIYVGKAKNIKKRVSSYFTNKYSGYKTHELVSRIANIEFTIVNHEHDALLLENTLIKENQPLFNINLKDDKTYPYIVVKNEHFPRVFFTRKKIRDGSTYYGPYTSVGKVRELLELVKQNIPLRTCRLNLTPLNIKRGKFKVCLEYHLGNCKGPCEGLQTEEEYSESLAQMKELLKGNISGVLASFKEKMQEHAANLQFEKAGFYQSKIEQLKNYQAKSAVANMRTGNADVFAIVDDRNVAYVSYLSIHDGNIYQTKVFELEKKLDESPALVLEYAVSNIREIYGSESKEIIVPFEIAYPENGIVVTVPKTGVKKQLLDLADKNAVYHLQELRRKKTLRLEDSSKQKTDEVLEKLKAGLYMKELPVHIECFDNSNFQGSFPVAAMVCFKNGIPDKSNYRRFNIKTVEGINDFASMEEIVFRRYSRLLDQGENLPQLVIIDGGKGQLSAAMKSIYNLDLQGKMTVVGLAKNFEEIFFPGDTESIKLEWDSEELKLIRRIRDEVHRFGITFHRDKRSKGTIKNQLEEIPGIGKSTATALLKEFKSVKKVQEAGLEELAAIIGRSKALKLQEYFREK